MEGHERKYFTLSSSQKFMVEQRDEEKIKAVKQQRQKC